MLIQRLQLLQRLRLLPRQTRHQPPIFHRQIERRRLAVEQRIVLRLGLRQPAGGRHQAGLLQLCRVSGCVSSMFICAAIGAGLRREGFQLVQLLLRQRHIALPQRQTHARGDHVRVVRIHQLEPVQRLAHQIVLVAGLANTHLFQQPLFRRHGFRSACLRQHRQTQRNQIQPVYFEVVHWPSHEGCNSP